MQKDNYVEDMIYTAHAKSDNCHVSEEKVESNQLR